MKIAQDLAAIVLNLSYKMPERPSPVSLSSEHVTPLLGLYSGENFSVELSVEGESYYLRYGKQVMPVYPISDYVFQHMLLDEQYEIKINKEGIPEIWGCQLQ